MELFHVILKNRWQAQTDEAFFRCRDNAVKWGLHNHNPDLEITFVINKLSTTIEAEDI